MICSPYFYLVLVKLWVIDTYNKVKYYKVDITDQTWSMKSLAALIVALNVAYGE